MQSAPVLLMSERDGDFAPALGNLKLNSTFAIHYQRRLNIQSAQPNCALMSAVRKMQKPSINRVVICLQTLTIRKYEKRLWTTLGQRAGFCPWYFDDLCSIAAWSQDWALSASILCIRVNRSASSTQQLLQRVCRAWVILSSTYVAPFAN